MCTSPIKINNNSHQLSVFDYKPFVLYVPCGKCAECRQKRSSSYLVRSYYEALRCFEDQNNKGWLLFDTLTYRPVDVPYIHDHENKVNWLRYRSYDGFAFHRDHITKFFKLLRTRLSRAGFDVNDKLRYFLTSEFGNDSEYIDDRGMRRHGTRRPHYHVLFYSNVPGLTYDVLSRYISKCWKYGRTDGLPYKSDAYVRNKRFFSSVNPYCMRILQYVSKYVIKQQKFDLMLRNKLFAYMCARHNSNSWMSTYHGRMKFRKLCHDCGSFFVSSQNFGAYALDIVPLDYIISHNALPMLVSKKSVCVDVPLHEYYIRKLFYETFDYNGQKLWRPSDLGRKYLTRLHDYSIDNLCNRLNDWHDRLPLPQRFVVDRIMNGFTFSDISRYVMNQKGRLKFALESDLYSEDAYKLSISSESFDYGSLQLQDNLVYPFNTVVDVERFGKRIVSFVQLPIKKYEDLQIFNPDYMSDYMSSKEFEQSFCFDNPVFDKVYQMYLDYLSEVGELKNEHSRLIEDVKIQYDDIFA